jgi:hypothetical protein
VGGRSTYPGQRIGTALLAEWREPGAGRYAGGEPASPVVPARQAGLERGRAAAESVISLIIQRTTTMKGGTTMAKGKGAQKREPKKPKKDKAKK